MSDSSRRPFIDECGGPQFFLQEYYVLEGEKHCGIRFRAEQFDRPFEKPTVFDTGSREGWNGIFALPAAYGGMMGEDIVRAADWMKETGRKQEARSFLARTAHFRSGGNPTGRSLYEMVKTLSEVEAAMISTHHNPVQDLPLFKKGEEVKTGARAAYAAAQAKAAPTMGKAQERGEGR